MADKPATPPKAKRPRSQSDSDLGRQAREQFARERHERHIRALDAVGAGATGAAKAFAHAVAEADALDLRGRALPQEKREPVLDDVWLSAELIAQAGINAPSAALAKSLFEQALALCEPFLPASSLAKPMPRPQASAEAPAWRRSEPNPIDHFAHSALRRWAVSAASLNRGQAIEALHALAAPSGCVDWSGKSIEEACFKADAWLAMNALLDAGSWAPEAIFPRALASSAWECAQSLWARSVGEKPQAVQDGLWGLARVGLSGWGAEAEPRAAQWIQTLIEAGADPFEPRLPEPTSRGPAHASAPALPGAETSLRWMEPFALDQGRFRPAPPSKTTRRASGSFEPRSAPIANPFEGWREPDPREPKTPAQCVLLWASRQSEKSIEGLRPALDAIDWARAPLSPTGLSPVGVVLSDPRFGRGLSDMLAYGSRGREDWHGHALLVYLDKKGAVDRLAPSPGNVMERVLALSLEDVRDPLVWAAALHGANLLPEKGKSFATPWGAPPPIALARAARALAETFKACDSTGRRVSHFSFKDFDLALLNWSSLSLMPQLSSLAKPWTSFVKTLRAYHALQEDNLRPDAKKSAAMEAIELSAQMVIGKALQMPEPDRPALCGEPPSTTTDAPSRGPKRL